MLCRQQHRSSALQDSSTAGRCGCVLVLTGHVHTHSLLSAPFLLGMCGCSVHGGAKPVVHMSVLLSVLAAHRPACGMALCCVPAMLPSVANVPVTNA